MPVAPSWAVPPNLKDEFPEVEEFVRITNNSMIVRYGDVKYKEDDIMIADSSAFSRFRLDITERRSRTPH